MSVKAFEDYSRENDTLSAYLCRPLLNTCTMNEIIKGSRIISKKKAEVFAIRKKVNVKPADSPAYWSRTDVQREYGFYKTTYRIMSEQYVNALASRRAENKVKDSKLSAKEKKERRLHTNAEAQRRKLSCSDEGIQTEREGPQSEKAGSSFC